MESPKEVLELDVHVESDGTAVIPARHLERLGIRLRPKLRVRLIPGILSRDLVLRGVTEEEIEHIGSLQPKKVSGTRGTKSILRKAVATFFCYTTVFNVIELFGLCENEGKPLDEHRPMNDIGTVFLLSQAFEKVDKLNFLGPGWCLDCGR